ncbi:secondary thiamine-phosphate synthase enzyme [Cladophialophora carrionii CBS 160.54]|uniref:Secondary thiamine-phosphate synthase enzyme n=1 Tax=Cladophialophora carrionii CBS 160.54 TaxID=1279043 RepID=V9DCD6_9EURO|nr:secondary thiamine-phosphate synthase enzyme [Cladophialophora carrionii CBS 160.54]ETI24564.1 secondary thiamine-phosphate synthase enzyme [Cladophialophora carrionii CBS 160.54]
MPALDVTQHRYFTLVSVLILVLALFPGVPQYLLGLPYHLLTLPFRNTNNPPVVVYCPAGCVPHNTYDDMSTSWFQKTFTLPSKSRGSYLITDHVVSSVPEIKDYKVGLLNLFIQHTSCALSLNENWDSDVREDMSDALDRIAPEDRKGNLYRHSAEGLDDMPAHIKSALVGASVTIPITDGTLNTGTWQGIWYLEFRAAKHSRKVVATIQGEKR